MKTHQQKRTAKLMKRRKLRKAQLGKSRWFIKYKFIAAFRMGYKPDKLGNNTIPIFYKRNPEFDTCDNPVITANYLAINNTGPQPQDDSY